MQASRQNEFSNSIHSHMWLASHPPCLASTASPSATTPPSRLTPSPSSPLLVLHPARSPLRPAPRQKRPLAQSSRALPGLPEALAAGRTGTEGGRQIHIDKDIQCEGLGEIKEDRARSVTSELERPSILNLHEKVVLRCAPVHPERLHEGIRLLLPSILVLVLQSIGEAIRVHSLDYLAGRSALIQ